VGISLEANRSQATDPFNTSVRISSFKLLGIGGDVRHCSKSDDLTKKTRGEQFLSPLIYRQIRTR
jgi:hypothetical protein